MGVKFVCTVYSASGEVLINLIYLRIYHIIIIKSYRMKVYRKLRSNETYLIASFVRFRKFRR